MSSSQGMVLKRLSIAIGFILAAGIGFAIGMVQPHVELLYLPNGAAQAQLPPEEEEDPRPSRAEEIMRALVKAYPRRVLKAEFRNGDWAVLLRDTWFYYAEGRLLPEELLYRINDYSPIDFHYYPRELPPWTQPDPEQVRQFREWSEARSAQPPRSPHFFDALYRAHDRDEAYTRVRSLRFFRNPVTVHNAILEYLALVEDRIFQVSRTDFRVRAWIYDIARVYGWNWGNAEGTQTRSFHSYGVVIGVMPRTLGARAIHWGAAGEWWDIPHERRHHPPEAVIQAFEAYGFVWGGKQPFFDTIHFTFRPEILILNGMELSDVR